MNLPVNPPVLPMLAKRIADIPAENAWIFEPKWDGFRALIFRDGEEILIQSRDGKSLNRYFPELLVSLASALPERCVLDGEIVIARDGALDFEALQLRVHPAASRVNLLARQTPASIVFFDLLALGDRDLQGEAFTARREQLESLLASVRPPLHLTPATRDRVVAADWFRRFEGAGLDGVIAKQAAGKYQPDKRVMLKVKHERECECVVAGFRWYKKGEQSAVGSLLLGLYDAAGSLQHVGVCASFTLEKRQELVSLLEPYRRDAAVNHPWNRDTASEEPAGDQQELALTATGSTAVEQRMPGGQSRWSQGKDLSWEPVRPELVAEVAYEHMQGTRFRHMAHFRRWRVDKTPRDCTYEQLEVVPPQELMTIFPADR